MANLTTSADILDFALGFVGEPTDGSSQYDADAILFLNEIYQQMLDDDRVEWEPNLKDPPGHIYFEIPIEGGTVNVQQDSVTAEFSAAPTPIVDSDVGGWFLKVGDDPQIYHMASISSTTGTLTQKYVKADNATATYKLFKLDYTLAADVKNLVAPMQVFTTQYGAFSPGEISFLSASQLLKDYPLKDVQQDRPSYFTFTGEQKVRFNRYPGERAIAYYEYEIIATDLADNATEPVIPRTERRVLAWGTTWLLAKHMNESQAGIASQLYNFGMEKIRRKEAKQMVKASREYGRLIYRPEQVRRFGVLRTESGMIIG